MRPCLALYMGVGGPNLGPRDCRAISWAQPHIVTLTYLRVFIIAQWPLPEFKFKPSEGEIKSPSCCLRFAPYSQIVLNHSPQQCGPPDLTSTRVSPDLSLSSWLLGSSRPIILTASTDTHGAKGHSACAHSSLTLAARSHGLEEVCLPTGAGPDIEHGNQPSTGCWAQR